MLAYVLNPLVVPPVALGLLAVHAGADDGAMIWIVSSATGMYVVLPGLMLFFLKRAGHIQSFEIRNRPERMLPMIGGIGFSLAAIPVVSLGAGAATELVALVASCLSVAAITAAIVTLRIKLSLHAAAYVALTVLLTWIAIFVPPAPATALAVGQEMVIASFFLIPVVVWGRLKSRAHTGVEIAAGIVFGLVAMSLSLYIVQMVRPLEF